MTAQDELTMLEASYTALLQGGVASYQINGRMATKFDIDWMSKRMDKLRAIVDRQTNGAIRVASMRPQE